MEINNYKISTIIPVYNSEKHIEEAIRSVINQTYKPYEIIIVNDNSGDYTLNKCEGFKEIFDNLKIVNLRDIDKFYNSVSNKSWNELKITCILY